MFHSIRWRLIVSYVLLTLLTVSVLGTLGYSFVKQYVTRQETAFLNSNAEAVAQQAQTIMRPSMDRSDLLELVTAASFLGNVRVRIFDDEHELLVDSGPPPEVDQLLWVMTPGNEFRIEATAKPFETFIFTLPYDYEYDSSIVAEIPFRFMEGLPEETRYRFVQRVINPWGNRIVFEKSSAQSLDTASVRSDRIFTFPIGGTNDPLGYVELRDGPSFVSETLETTARAFVLAAVGALILAGVVGLLMARRLTSPLMQLMTIAGQMSEGDLSVRAPSFGKDEIGQLARQFNRMVERLEASFTELATERDTLRRFIADASHELRTPITALISFNELLQQEAKDDLEAQAEFLAESEVQLGRLEWITNNLLSMSRLEAGLTPLKLEKHDMGELLKSLLIPFKVQAEEKNIVLIDSLPKPPFEFCADKALIELALSNLIDNALKFTPAGGQVKIGASKSDDTIRLWVRDNGPGIDPVDLPHIFERFYRGRKSDVEGSGLGLAMAESVVLAHGGQITVESELGAGSHFVIELPYEVKGIIEDHPQADGGRVEV